MKVIIIGSGVIGLTSGVVLQEAGWPVRIISREMAAQTTSAAAAAIWYPYKAYPPERVLAWSKRSYQAYQTLSHHPAAGVTLVRLHELLPYPAGEPWWQAAVPEYRHLAAAELPPGYAAGYELTVPLMETPIYLGYLQERFRAGGGQIEQQEVKELKEWARPQTIIINCTGLGARELVNDNQLYPIRGQISRVITPGFIPTILDEHNLAGLTYIIPRRDGVIIGGTAQEKDARPQPDEHDSQGIWQRAVQLVPQLAFGEIAEQRVGLRPGRAAVRLEQQWLTPECPIIHNYGHGGAGFTLSWGCAYELLTLCQALKS
ncbi:MAG: FAD-binding oxidoreductase [Anaerolineae bacterium]|nr:FAD-binding oxidoreductase [Anaerolineae bacterium]